MRVNQTREPLEIQMRQETLSSHAHKQHCQQDLEKENIKMVMND